jgi:hypothetical protein
VNLCPGPQPPTHDCKCNCDGDARCQRRQRQRARDGYCHSDRNRNRTANAAPRRRRPTTTRRQRRQPIADGDSDATPNQGTFTTQRLLTAQGVGGPEYASGPRGTGATYGNRVDVYRNGPQRDCDRLRESARGTPHTDSTARHWPGAQLQVRVRERPTR